MVLFQERLANSRSRSGVVVAGRGLRDDMGCRAAQSRLWHGPSWAKLDRGHGRVLLNEDEEEAQSRSMTARSTAMQAPALQQEIETTRDAHAMW